MKSTLALAVCAAAPLLQDSPDCFNTLVGDAVTFQCTNCGPPTNDTFIVEDGVAELVLFDQLEVDVEASSIRINWLFEANSIISDINFIWSDLDFAIPGEIVGVIIDPSSTWGSDATIEFTEDSVSLVNNDDTTVVVGDFFLAHLEVRPDSGACHTLDFETEDDFATPVVHGQDISTPPEFGNLVSISSSGMNGGPAIFDSTQGGPADLGQDQDLLVDTGNVLMLQNDNNAQVMQQTEPGFFDFPNDDPDGGTLTFSFACPVAPLSIRLVDADVDGASNEVVLTDSAGRNRTFDVPPDWTGDRTLAQPGMGTLDLTSLAPQAGFGSVATATEVPGFEIDNVVRIDVNLAGSGAVDDLSWCPTTPEVIRAEATLRNGSNQNPETLANWSPPLIGGSWVTGLDCGAHANGNALLLVRSFPLAGLATPFGELLVGGDTFLFAGKPHLSSVAFFSNSIPHNPALVGTRAYAQGICTGSPGPRLSNAVDIVIGF